MNNQFKTTLIWHDSRGGECEAECRVTYRGIKGFAGDLTDPPEPDSIEIISIVDVANPKDAVPDHFFEQEELIAECMEDWAASEIEAAEWREQSRRDQLMGGF
ncbi:hypothetical protein [Rhizorhabdus histidinilytica]|uniref:hypothetical protein n=1 Tax=Rhizorhabdus histidinilytica TaxID=439228 RepID=UPI003220214F